MPVGGAMSTFLDRAANDLAVIREAGHWKRERAIASPQRAKVFLADAGQGRPARSLAGLISIRGVFRGLPEIQVFIAGEEQRSGSTGAGARRRSQSLTAHSPRFVAES